MPVPPEWPSRISERPLKSAIRKLTSRAPIASASSPASTSTAATGGAASTAASNAFKFTGDRPLAPISPNLARPLAKAQPSVHVPNRQAPLDAQHRAGGAGVRWHAAGGSSKAAHDANPNAGYPARAGSAGDDRSLGCTGGARGPLSAADTSALATPPLAEDALGSGSRIGRRHAPSRLPGCPSFCDHFVAALTWRASLARGSRTAASPCPGAQGTRVGTAVYEPR